MTEQAQAIPFEPTPYHARCILGAPVGTPVVLCNHWVYYHIAGTEPDPHFPVMLRPVIEEIRLRRYASKDGYVYGLGISAARDLIVVKEVPVDRKEQKAKDRARDA